MDEKELREIRKKHYACAWYRKVFDRKTNREVNLDFSLFDSHSICPKCVRGTKK